MNGFTLLVEAEETAADTDLLNGSDLEKAPTKGVIYLWAASTVNTATLEVNQYGHQPSYTQLLRKRTDGIPNLTDDPCWILAVKQGERPKLVLGGTTGTVHWTAGFVPSK